ncbi:50S ribosomal protein L27 [uncultured bacterium]|uniref:Putative 50S ribosomal protein L27 n=1 Tax=uncultured microorganism TaxID=358574 RepID=A0A077JJM0_9ZZZZ|nr:putative 50S ribosomal protein L27 [uncultured microorganism]BCL65658.1 50S ribosomal protein L27 [uncultured bacterium]
MAKKKVGGSSKNGRDSIGRRLGIKINNLQSIKPGQIILRQRGQRYKCGDNVYMGIDHTIHSFINGFVFFYKKQNKSFVSVIK